MEKINWIEDYVRIRRNIEIEEKIVIEAFKKMENLLKKEYGIVHEGYSVNYYAKNVNYHENKCRLNLGTDTEIRYDLSGTERVNIYLESKSKNYEWYGVIKLKEYRFDMCIEKMCASDEENSLEIINILDANSIIGLVGEVLKANKEC